MRLCVNPIIYERVRNFYGFRNNCINIFGIYPEKDKHT
ncbi:hypothetical protein APHWI1_1554 [Anaplasma phagocytophilum str. ApWI1]|uniref:Uncharacterized protein n=2 Tax=Anaplasma phagocytophilum TaxID=948 RepID=A0A0F3PVA8_ANAPH|nr:hypothetical protein EPHNCH_1641 [Anaplasma phagocytophilum str. NCH-1]KJV60309.1 hypothetical protein APHWEB_1539 [Anaplasma phagocytophilum str. Webster]KJV82320.1 hypothetical protein APHHGE2_0786 [Anaplasma phagocytophilum str. HGE2]KJV84300.1 hypothetical protein APHWI1_1566 [Anaplasma phagocytophilum str. ApWI1]KJV87633.1 hypothetical protein APHNYW_0515 [Anaplasma phagocytophilum str. ApNYW]KJV98903.1 hypothetical protein OTSANNIE_0755 [Anaplasma phagocytophilum str. Annie]KJZ98190.